MSGRNPRQVQKIERVTDSIIRRRINLIRPKSVRMCTKYLYVIDGRPSEVVCKAYASDRRTVARGPVGIDAKIDVYYPERFATVEEAFKEQKETGVKHVHPAVIFKVKTAKRRGRPRYCAVPIDPEMEPWAQELAQYFDEFGEDDVFPFTRQRLWERTKKVWRDLLYVIEDYSVVLDKSGSIVMIEEEGAKSTRVDRHLRGWNLSALRHLRASDLVDYYNFNGANLSSFGGWTMATAMKVSTSIDRYLDLDWRSYHSKLLRKRYEKGQY